MGFDSIPTGVTKYSKSGLFSSLLLLSVLLLFSLRVAVSYGPVSSKLNLRNHMQLLQSPEGYGTGTRYSMARADTPITPIRTHVVLRGHFYYIGT